MNTVLRGRDGLEVVISPDGPFTPIGERLNPTNKPRLQRAYDRGDWAYVQRDARRQVAAGARVIDVNTGDPYHEVERRKMRDAVRAVQDAVEVPVSIDSYTVDVLLAGLDAAQGRPLVNSVPFETEYMDELLPAVAERGAAMIGMCTKGGAAMPQTAQERVDNARALIHEAARHGVAADAVVIDPVCLPIGASDAYGPGLLEAIRILASEDGVNMSIGLSNVSFGLPNRRSLNAAALLLAMQAGLSAAILDMTHKEMRHAVFAADLLRGFDEYSARWIQNYRSEEAARERRERRRAAKAAAAGAEAPPVPAAEPAADDPAPPPLML